MFRLAHNILHLIWPGWTDYDPAKKLEAAVKETGIAFIHIPKCAGNSVGEYLYGFGPGHRTWRWFRRLDAHSVAACVFVFSITEAGSGTDYQVPLSEGSIRTITTTTRGK